MKENINKQGTIHVFFARTRRPIRSQRLYHSVYRSRVISTTFTRRFPSGTMSRQGCTLSTHATDQRMVVLSFKYGVTTSLILVTISDATLVPGVRRLIWCLAHSCGADRPSQTLLIRLSHSRSPLTDSKTRRMTLNTGTITIQMLKRWSQTLVQLKVVP